MKPTLTSVATAVVALSMAAAAQADTKPRGAQLASPEKIAAAYSGKTDLWQDNCGGGIYFSPNNLARAWCEKDADVVGAGTWSIDDAGRLCQKLNWYYPDSNGGAGKSEGERNCINHVVDRWGKLWRNWPGDTEWWPVDSSSGLVRGYKFRSNVEQAESRAGL